LTDKKSKSSEHKHLDEQLSAWPYEVDGLNVRRTQGADGRELLQLRVEMGILQLEIEGRPDGERPSGANSYFDHLAESVLLQKGEFELTEEQCEQVDREFVQFYHRRVCWLRLQEYRRAVADADHTLGLMDFCKVYSPDDQWTMSHEQYRPFVLFHRTQAMALARLEEDGPEAAVQEVTEGLGKLQVMFEEFGVDEHFEDDELVNRLIEFRESMRREYDVGKTLKERLHDAIESEQYELAARLRDELAQREPRH